MPFGVAVEEGEGGGVPVIRGEFVPPSGSYPRREGPASMIEIKTGGLKLAFTEGILPAALADLGKLEHDFSVAARYIGVLAETPVGCQHVGNDVAAVQLLALGRGLPESIVARAMVHLGVPDVRIERAHFDAANAIFECRGVPGDINARFVDWGLDPHGPADGLIGYESDRNMVVVLAGVHGIGQHQ